MTDIRECNRRAVDYSAEIVSRVTADDLDRPTPCAAWKLSDLLAHMTVQHRGFAAAARGRGGDPAVWQPAPLADDPIADYRDAAADVLAAFTEKGVPERDFAMAEFGPDVTVPGQQAIGFHFIDYVVHGWDVARTLGFDYHLADDLAEPALEIALAVPDNEVRLAPGAPFAPAVRAGESATALDRILAALGRSPQWPN
ncbi:TIGR03086 family metal-binding protein [Nocardia sp. CDC159]|uniref:TIGR03086 family metal-binding protein n=2 Tax=Nocardiaceae TaxID=85025 RepID=A0A9X2EBH0_9NOCA|nr:MULTISPECIES: TIGR03086 family metal-binding protein [Nocardia]MCM6777647.1 TIGR03086 family metal-binding protein [Nocardia pulmonis]MCM6790549.1 TIGR03086 family metal-binding protein [Nocardia sp. CDC159]